jgi:hypothetical protein
MQVSLDQSLMMHMTDNPYHLLYCYLLITTYAPRSIATLTFLQSLQLLLSDPSRQPLLLIQDGL